MRLSERTRARPGFVESVTELVLGLLVDLNRGISSSAPAYRSGEVPTARMGRQLSGTTIGIMCFKDPDGTVLEVMSSEIESWGR